MRYLIPALILAAACTDIGPTSPEPEPQVNLAVSTGCAVTLVQPRFANRGFISFAGASVPTACPWVPQIHAVPQSGFKLCGWRITTNGVTSRLPAVTPIGLNGYPFVVSSPTSVFAVFEKLGVVTSEC